MAGLVSVSFSIPLCTPKFSIKEIQLRKAVLFRISGQASTRIANNILSPCSSNRSTFSMNQICHGYVKIPLDHFGEHVPSCMNASYCTREIIIGYWVGPDVDDGWGFVEAFVNQIT